MVFTGTAHCSNGAEADAVMGQLSGLANVVATRDDLLVDVSYEAKDIETDLEIKRTVARLADILEPIAQHGISVLSERR